MQQQRSSSSSSPASSLSSTTVSYSLSSSSTTEALGSYSSSEVFDLGPWAAGANLKAPPIPASGITLPSEAELSRLALSGTVSKLEILCSAICVPPRGVPRRPGPDTGRMAEQELQCHDELQQTPFPVCLGTSSFTATANPTYCNEVSCSAWLDSCQALSGADRGSVFVQSMSRCGLRSAPFAPSGSCKGKLCPVCQVAEVGFKGSGLVKTSQQLAKHQVSLAGVAAAADSRAMLCVELRLAWLGAAARYREMLAASTTEQPVP
eukprot:3934729-Rhodomonas_salina.2